MNADNILATLLLVDDQQPILDTLRYVFESAGFRVLTARSGADAVTHFQAELIHAAIVDVHMPVMHGFDVCTRLIEDAQKAGKRVPKVWMMTGAPSRELIRRADEIGAVGVFAKPFDFSEALTVITNTLADDGGDFH